MGVVYGIGTYIRELTAALRHSPINVCVVKILSGKPQIQIEEIDNVRYFHIPTPVSEQRTIDPKRQDELYFRNVTYLLQLFIEDKNNLIFHFNYMEHKPLADALKKVFDCKIVSVVHYLMSVMCLLGNSSKFSRIITQTDELTNDEELSVKKYFQKEKEMLLTTDKVIVLSNYTFNLLHQYFQIEKGKMIVINNGLADRQLTMDKQMLRQKYQIPDIPVVIFAGRLDDIKGLKYALQSFRLLLNTLPHCHFIIAGDGAFNIYMKECEDIWMHITWTGRVNKEKLYELYAIADIGVMPSLYEPFGYVALEMMMHGLPIVATSTSGLNEVVDETCGLKIPISELPDKVEIDTELLAEKIAYLLEHPEEAKIMGQNGRKRYLKEYSSKVFGNNMLEFYNSCELRVAPKLKN